MKKHTVIALVSAIAIAAGTLSAVNLTNTSREAQGSVQNSGESAGISYEDAIADLYARSTSISDQEILDIARKMKPDCTAVTNKLGEAQADRIIATLSDYEEKKASYLLADSAAEADESLAAEWDRQKAYTQMGISGSQKLTRLIPGYTVTSCEEENGRILVDVDEWMTEGYTEGEQETENVSAYRYYYTAVLEKKAGGNYEVISVINTDRNFAWLEDAEVQQQMLEETADQAGAENSADLQSKSAADLKSGNGMKTASLKIYGDGKYSYNADNAIAYADKWATSRNPEYRQYPGVDCCNFVSQCLYAGGMPKNSAWYPASYAWINCSGAIDNFKKYGTFMSANNGNVLRGNPVYYDWNSNGVYDHTAICVGKNSSGTPIIDAHTGDHYHVTWTLGSNGTRATIQLRGNGSVGGSSTAAATGGAWKKEGGKWYYYSADGNMVKGWILYQNKYYYLKSDGSMVTGWGKVGDSWYYFNGSGAMQTGWVKVSSKWYYLSDQGAMKTGWVQDKGVWYYMADDGHAVTGWRDIKGKTYYFDDNCKMATGIAKIDGMKYNFGSQGHMTLGWATVGGKKYFFSPSAGGRAATGTWLINGRYYNFNSEGVLID